MVKKSGWREEYNAKRLKKLTTDCRHFRGIQFSECAAGINMRTLVGGKDLGWAARLPCLPSMDKTEVSCSKFEVMSEEDAKQEIRKEEERRLTLGKAHKAAHEDAKAKGLGQGHGGVGMILCPACGKGELRYSVASVNGHLWGRCSTPGCAQWME